MSEQQQKDECMSEGPASMRGQLEWFAGRLELNGYGALPCGRCGRYGDLRVQDIHDGLEYLLASQVALTQRAEAAESKLSALIASVREIAEKSKAEANAATETAKEAESKRMYVTAADQLARAVVHQEIAEALLSALQQSIGDTQ